jgi:hypothetical protein
VQPDDLRRIVVLEGGLPAQQVVEHRAEGVEIGTAVRTVPLRHLRGEIERGAHDELPRVVVRALRIVCGHREHAEVDESGVVGELTGGAEEDVFGFHVPVDDTTAMEHLQAGRHLPRNVHRASRFEDPARVELALEVLPDQTLHGQPGAPVGQKPAIERRDDVGHAADPDRRSRPSACGPR